MSDASQRPRYYGWTLVILAVLVPVSVWTYVWATTERASGERAKLAAELRQLAMVARLYQDDHGRIPHLNELAPPEIDRQLAARFAEPPTDWVPGANERRVIYFLRVPYRSVKKGEPWGGPGETAAEDKPAGRFVLYHDWQVEGVTETEFQRRHPALSSTHAK